MKPMPHNPIFQLSVKQLHPFSLTPFSLTPFSASDPVLR
jgi:hypothetical protein